jgi:tRNA(Arg) A34 adenosine deaminase TadA
MCYTAAWLARVEAIVYAATMDEVHALLGDAQRELRVSVERMNALTDEPLALVSGVCRDSSLALFERWARNAA